MTEAHHDYPDVQIATQDAEDHEIRLRAACIATAAAIMVDSKLFESGIVSADDLGPYICEVAEQMCQYILEGKVPEYKELNSDNG